MTAPADPRKLADTVRGRHFGWQKALDALVSLAEQLQQERDEARREADWQMGSKLDAQTTLLVITKALDLPLNELGDGWKEAAPKILARIETIVDEAERAFQERDALAEAQQFPTETVLAWKQRVESSEALMRYARLLLDPERQDEPDEENALRAYEALSGAPVSIEAGLPSALRRAESAEAALRTAQQESAELRAALTDELDNWNPERRPTIAAELRAAQARAEELQRERSVACDWAAELAAWAVDVTDGMLRMKSEREVLVDSLWTLCPVHKVPYGEYGCTHHPPTSERLLAAIAQIASEEWAKNRRRLIEHALRYRAEARQAGEKEAT